MLIIGTHLLCTGSTTVCTNTFSYFCDLLSIIIFKISYHHVVRHISQLQNIGTVTVTEKEEIKPPI